HGRLADPSLEHFVHSVIEDEFQGAPPSQADFNALIAYLRALDANACRGDAAITLDGAAGDVRRALAAAERAAERADAPSASALLLAAQDAMGRLVERLPQARFGHERAGLETLARELGALRASGEINASLATAAAGWNARFDAIVADIAPRARQTYFNEATLRAALSGSLALCARPRRAHPRPLPESASRHPADWPSRANAPSRSACGR